METLFRLVVPSWIYNTGARVLACGLLLLASVQASNVGRDWTPLAPKPTGNDLRDVVWTGARYVAVGNAGALMTSTDGVTWTFTDVHQDCTSVAWSGSKLVVGTPSNSEHVLTSTDGVSWTTQAININGWVEKVTWAQSQFVGISRSYNSGNQTWSLITSPDGISWTSHLIANTDDTLSDVAWTGSRYVVVGFNYNQEGNSNAFLSSSADGVSWTNVAMDDEAVGLTSVVWTGTRVVAVSFAGIYTSETGAAPWTKQVVDEDIPEYDPYLDDVIWTGSQLVAVGYYNTLTSPDGITWTASNAEGFQGRAVTAGGDRFVAVGSGGTTYTSPDTAIWTQRTPLGSNVQRNGVAWTGSQFVSVGGYPATIETSPDGEVWTAQSLGEANYGILTGVTWTGTKLVTIDSSGITYSSPDGVTWTKSFPDFGSSSGTFNAIASNSSLIVVVGSLDFSDGLIITSPDGATWTRATLPAGVQELFAVTYTGTQWVAVGQGGVILTSPNGTTWTKRNSGTQTRFTGVAGNGALIVVSGDDSTLLSSGNSTTWTNRTPQNLYSIINSLTWTGTDFVGMGYRTAITSTDGINWNVYENNIALPMYGMAWSGSKLLAVGFNGSVYGSDGLPTLNMVASAVQVPESAGIVQVQVNLSFPSLSPLTIPIGLGGSATEGAGNDYTVAASSITIPAGQTSGSVAITLINDATVEMEETVRVDLNPILEAHIGPNHMTELTIIDDDGPPPVNFTREMAVAQEHAGTVGVRVELGWPAPPGGVSVPIISTGQTDDVSGVPSTLTFAAGESSKFISIAITDDELVENNETVTLTLGTPTGGVLGTSTVFTLTIEDNDPNTEPGKRWTLRHPRPSAEFLTSIATNGSRQVIVGGSGGVLTSDDAGLTWTPRYTGSNAYYNRVIAVGATGFLAVSDYGHVATSPDGIAWSDIVLPETSNSSFLGAASNGPKTVIVGYDYSGPVNVPFIFSSSDLVHWNRSSVPAAARGNAQAVVWNGSKFLLVGGSYDMSAQAEQAIVMTSTDGAAWTLGPAPASKLVENVIWAGDKFIAFDYSTKGYTSPDGVTWTTRTLGAKYIATGISVTGTQVLAVGGSGVIASSTNGTTWTQRSSGTTLAFQDVVKTSTNYIAIGGNHSILTSPDGVVWTTRSAGADVYGSLSSVVWSGTKFVAVGGDYYDSAAAMLSFTSPDGTNWTKSTTAVKATPLAIAWSGSVFVGVGTNGSIATSADGLAWTSRTSGSALDLHDVLWSGSQFVAVGGNESNEDFDHQVGGSIVLTSPNGTTWTRRTIPTIHALEGIAFNSDDNVYVAVGRSTYDGGNTEAIALTSPDAVNWTAQNTGVMGKDLGHVIRVGPRFIATREGFGMVRSLDGITWEAFQMPELPPGVDELNLHGLCWTGPKVVVVADGGFILSATLQELEGLNGWTLHQTDAHNLALYGVAWNGATLVAVGENTVIETSSTGEALAPSSVQFVKDSSAISESGGTASILVTVTPPPVAKVTVPYRAVGGTGVVLTGALADATVPAGPLVFNPGETAKYINVVIKPDARNEADEKIIFTLGPNITGATEGSRTTYELTINNDDLVPGASFAASSINQLVQVGEPISLTVNATGTPPLTYVWKKNNAAVPGATGPTLFVAAAALTHAGAYTCTVNNPTALPFTTGKVEVGVYEKTSRNFAGLATKDVVLTQAAAGNGLSFFWFKDGSLSEVEASDTAVYDTTKKTLTLKQPIGAGALGNYRCQVFQSFAVNGEDGIGVDANSYNVTTVTAKPTLGTITLPQGQVGVFYARELSLAPGSARVATWSAVGLPAGLTIDPSTGDIRGYPTTAVVNKAVTITATNAVGSTSSVGVKMTVTGIPAGIAGIWNGLISRDEAVNKSLGSRLEITVTTMGTYTGKIITGATSVSIGGQVKVTSESTSASTLLVLNGNTLAELEFDFDSTGSAPVLSGTITATPPGAVSSTTLSLFAWRAKTSVSAYVGKHNFALDPGPAPSLVFPSNVPHGTGFGTATVTATGAVTTAGKVSDGSLAYTSSSFIGTSGECLLYGSLYGGKGTIIGSPVIKPAPITTGGSLPPVFIIVDADGASTSWNKLPDTTAAGARTYAAGWEPVSLSLRGQRYIAPAPAATAVVMGLTYSPGMNNATLIFSDGGLPPSDIETDVGIKANGTIAPILPANPYKITLTVTPSSGAFKGTLNLTQTVNGVVIKRDPIAYEGLIIPNRYPASSLPDEGVGFFMLPQLPDAGISPLPPAASTPILGGRVVLSPMDTPF